MSLARVPDEPTREEWRRLYEAALAYRACAPWQWLSDADLFGVQDPVSGEIGWCSVFGAAGELFGLFVYAGSEGLATYLRMAGRDLDSDELPYIQQGWLATFEDRPVLDKRDLATIKALGLAVRGRRAWPRFRSHRPGYVPWYLTSAEARFLTLALEQAAAVATRCRDPVEALGPDAAGRFLVRAAEPESAGVRWEDRRLAPPPLPLDEPAPPMDQARVDRVRRAATLGPGTWECDAFYSPAIIDDGQGRPFFAPSVLLVDRDSGMILDARFGEPPLAAPFIRDRLLSTIEAIGTRPRVVLTKGDHILDALGPLADALEIRVERARRLPALEQARRSMESFLQRR